MVDQGILNSNVSIEEQIYNFEKGLKDDGSDWTGFPQIDLKEDSQCIYICGISETDRWHLFYTLTKIKPATPIASLGYYRVRDNLIFSKHSQWIKLQMEHTEYDLIFLEGVQLLERLIKGYRNTGCSNSKRIRKETNSSLYIQTAYPKT